MTDEIDTSPAAIAAILEGVTPGPWAYNVHREVGPLHTDDDQAFGMICNVVCEVNFDDDYLGNARFIAAARELVPALAAERDRLAALSEEWRVECLRQNAALSAALDRAEKAEAENARLREALIWCSGSADFNEGGIAADGWQKLCAPLLKGDSHE